MQTPRTLLATFAGIMAIAPATPSVAQTAGTRSATTMTSDTDLRARDYQHMLDVLKIALPSTQPAQDVDPDRPPNIHRNAKGRWADEAGNQFIRSAWKTWTNYDEAKANPFPIPDVLQLKSGQHVTDANTWSQQRRPEILKDYQTEIFGTIPANTPTVTWQAVTSISSAYDATIRNVHGHLDNSAYPAATPSIEFTMYLPAHATKRVPVVITIESGSPPSNSSTSTPANTSAPVRHSESPRAQALALGWGYATFYTSQLQADNGAGLNTGIIGLVNHGQPRKPDDWGTLAAWSWGLSRAIDYLETDEAVDAKRLAIEGHSRWGKTALVAAAYDPRWAICFSSCSGEGGAKLSRRNYGETLDDVAGMGEYHWMAPNFVKYGGHWNDLPVDAHELLALIAPRPLFITGGTTDRWADPHGEFLASVAASPVYELLGKRGLGITEMPAPDVEVIDGDLAFRYHEGGHTDSLDWPTFFKFAQRQFASTRP